MSQEWYILLNSNSYRQFDFANSQEILYLSAFLRTLLDDYRLLVSITCIIYKMRIKQNVSIGSWLVLIQEGSKQNKILSLISQGTESNIKPAALGSCSIHSLPRRQLHCPLSGLNPQARASQQESPQGTRPDTGIIRQKRGRKIPLLGTSTVGAKMNTIEGRYQSPGKEVIG